MILEDAPGSAVSYLQSKAEIKYAQGAAPRRWTGHGSPLGNESLAEHEHATILQRGAGNGSLPSGKGSSYLFRDSGATGRGNGLIAEEVAGVSTDGRPDWAAATAPEGGPGRRRHDDAPSQQLLQSLSERVGGGSASATFRCQQLLPLGSWALFAILCASANFGFCYVLGLYRSERAGQLSKLLRLPHKASACVFCGCMCVLALQCLAMARCLEGRLEFLHIPKNAGTTIEVAGRGAGISWGVSNIGFRFSRRMPDGSACSSYHIPPRHLHGLSPYAGAELFCVTRHPYQRAVSEYSYLLSAPWAEKYSEAYGNGIFDKPACSAEGLNHFVQTVLALHLGGRQYVDNCHHVSQAEFIWDGSGAQRCAHVLRQEDLPGAFDLLMARRGYPLRLPSEHVNSESHFCRGLSAGSLSEETRRMLRRVYADDFRLLNYSAW